MDQELQSENKITVGFLVIDKHVGLGGLENVLVDIVDGLTARGMDVKVLMLQATEERAYLKRFSNINVMKDISLNPISQQLPRALQRLQKKIKFIKAAKVFLNKELDKAELDCLIVLNLSKNFIRVAPVLALYKERNPKIPLIAWPHGSFESVKKSVRQALREKLMIFDQFFAISGGLQKELEDYFAVKNITLLYNPVKSTKNIPTRDPEKLIYVGRVNDPRKRINQLLQLMQGLKGDWTLDLIGGTGSNDGDTLYREYIASLGLANHVRLHGWQDRPWEHVKEAGLLLLYSTNEGFPLNLLEAMIRGIPCLSINCPVGPNEIIEHGKNGWLTDLDKEDDFLNMMQRVISGAQVLPSQADIIASVQKFSEEVVLQNFQLEIMNAIARKL